MESVVDSVGMAALLIDYFCVFFFFIFCQRNEGIKKPKVRRHANNLFNVFRFNIMVRRRRVVCPRSRNGRANGHTAGVQVEYGNGRRRRE